MASSRWSTGFTYLEVHITQSKENLTYHRTRFSGCIEAQVLESFEGLGSFEIVWL